MLPLSGDPSGNSLQSRDLWTSHRESPAAQHTRLQSALAVLHQSHYLPSEFAPVFQSWCWSSTRPCPLQHSRSTLHVETEYNTQSLLLLAYHWRSYVQSTHTGHNTATFGASEQCFTSPPTQHRLYGRRFLQVKRPNQQYQSTEGDATKEKENNENS